jgi:hypothetical protein
MKYGVRFNFVFEITNLEQLQKPSVPIVGIAPSKDGGVIRVPDNLFLHSDECSFAFAIQHGHIDPKEPKKAV